MFNIHVKISKEKLFDDILWFLIYSNMTADQMLFTEKDLEKSMDKIETVHFHEVKLKPPQTGRNSAI